jgi:hypothetical protein
VIAETTKTRQLLEDQISSKAQENQRLKTDIEAMTVQIKTFQEKTENLSQLLASETLEKEKAKENSKKLEQEFEQFKKETEAKIKSLLSEKDEEKVYSQEKIFKLEAELESTKDALSTELSMVKDSL